MGDDPKPETLKAGEDLAKDLYALADQIMERRRANLDYALRLLDKFVKANENGASFYEKLILFNVGTIALSLTLLEQVIAHSPGAHVPRHPFLWFLCPAWFCLLFSMLACTHRLVSFHNTNNRLIAQISALSGEAYSHDVNTLIGRTPNWAKQIQVPLEPGKTIGDILKTAGEVLIGVAAEKTGKANELLQEAVKQEKKISAAARLAILATTAALFLICVFAIRVILQL